MQVDEILIISYVDLIFTGLVAQTYKNHTFIHPGEMIKSAEFT